MTPAERGERAARVCSCKSCRPRLARVVETEIVEAVAPLLVQIRRLLVTPLDAKAQAEAREELAKWA